MNTLLPQPAEVLAKLLRHRNLPKFRSPILLAIAILLFSFAIPRAAAVQPLAPGDWIWFDGSSTIGPDCVSTYPCGQPGVYGSKGTIASGNIPGSRSDAMSWTDGSGNKWLFGGFGYGAGGALGEMNDLWQSGALGNAWGWFSGSNGPGHSGVYGTLGTPASTTVPGGRQDAMTWTDKSGNLWLFGGLGYDGSATSTYGYENDLWMYNTTTNQWTWESGSSTVPAPTSTIYGTLIGASPGVYGTLGTPASGNTPSGRTNAASWTDSNGNLWLFGGGVVDELGYEDVYNDLWEFNTTTKLWTWVGGGNTQDEYGVYGTFQTAASGNVPGARFLASGWTDSSGNFWLFGGSGYASNAGELNLNDLWKFSTSTGQWTWMGGASILYPCNVLFSTPCPVPGTYGTLGTAALTNFPGARNAATTWIDSSGNLWLFGGAGQDANNFGAWLNDLWEYNPGTTEWTWMGGSSTIPSSCTTGNCGQPGVYGSLDTAASTSVPGARQTAVSWTDQSGNLWLFGGWGVVANGATGYLNDMWEYQPPSASTTAQAATPTFSVQTGIYTTAQTVTINDTTSGATIYYTTNNTTPTTSSSSMSPGGSITVSSSETVEAIAVASGYTNSEVATANYTIGTPAATPTFSIPTGTYSSAQTVTINDSTSGATIYYTTNGTSPATSSSSLTPGGTVTVSSSETLEALATASGYTTSAIASAAYTITPFATGAVNDWTWIGGSSTVPGALLGQSGVYGTLGTPAAGNIPGGRYYANRWTDKNGNLWLFGGLGDDAHGNIGSLNDLWKFNPATNQWAWVSGTNTVVSNSGPSGVYGTLGTAAAGNVPGGRQGATSWIDSSGNLWLFGGLGYDANGVAGYLNDIWKFNPSTNQWIWMAGSNAVPGSHEGQPGIYGTLGTAAAGNIPGGRYEAASWIDIHGNLWLFGGLGDAGGVGGVLNDLWEFSVATSQWAWMGGSNTVPASATGTGGNSGVYGTLGTAAAGNVPGSRYLASAWTDSSGNLWLFGGYGDDASGNYGYLNDLWEFNPSSNQWTWMGGSSTEGTNCTVINGLNTCGQRGVYGTFETPAAGNIPGARFGANHWTDSYGHLWLSGGFGYDLGGGAVYLNDLWEFVPSTNQWAWMDGASTFGDTFGIYGTLNTPAPLNLPGGRFASANWTDSSGNLWLFGGLGFDVNGLQGSLNDLWSYQPAATILPVAVAPTFSLQAGTYTTTQSVTISDTTPGATIYYTTDGSTPTTGSFVYSAAITISPTETLQAIAAASGYFSSPVTTAVYTLAPAAATPGFSLGSGTYATAQTVTITDTTPGAIIHYTTNGATPTINSAVFSGTAITVSSTETLQAIAIAPSYSISAVGSATYTISAATAGTNEWTWISGSDTGTQQGVYGTLGVPTSANSPGGRSGAASWSDSSGNLWLFGGNDLNSFFAPLNDLWEFNPKTNDWTWMGGSAGSMFSPAAPGVYGTLGTPAAGNVPGGRFYSATWTDASGHFWLFGGDGNDSTGAKGYLNDLWEFNPVSNQWTWIGGSSTIGAKGGLPGVYGTLGIPAAGNNPGSRDAAVTWTDANGNLWLFGGGGLDANGASGYLNDLWKFNLSTSQWTWMAGSSTLIENAQTVYGRAGVYGTLGTPAAGNIPGSRVGATAWTDRNGNLWLFGGVGFDSTSASSDLNDLWEFNPKTNLWAWMGGSNTGNHPGVYGTQGTPAAGNIPGGMYQGSAWTDAAGNFWLFAGFGTDANNVSGALNDLWMFSPSTNQWTWVDGASTVTCSSASGVQLCFQPAVYGTLGVPAPGSIPGGRGDASTWVDSSGNLLVFGGIGFDVTGTSGYLNDLWKYQLNATASPAAATPTFSIAAGTYGTPQSVTISDTTPGATIYYTTNGTTPTTSSSVYSGAIMVSSTETLEAIATASGYTTSPVATAAYTINLTAAATPTFSVTPGTYSSAQTVTISDTTPGATIYYTTNGTTPTTGSSVYSGAITVSSSETLDAIATASGYTPSPVATAAYTINLAAAATPTFSVSGGTYSSSQTVTISDTTPGATIYYTTNGSTPSTSSSVYSGAITVSSTEALEAIATASGYTTSAVATAAYTINGTVQITLGTSPAGLSFSVDGTTYTSAQTLSWTVGSSHSIATTSPQTNGGTQNTYASWSDSGAISHSVTAPSTATSYTAVFGTSYQLTTAANPSADGTVTPPTGTYYAAGTVVNLTATPNSGYSFTNWTGSVASAGSASTTVMMNAAQSVTANFSAVVVSAPVASLTPPSLTFTSTPSVASAAQVATLSNTGNVTLTITGISIAGTNPTDFAVTTGSNACGSSLAAGSTCSIYVTFTPASATSFAATLTVADNASGSLQTTTLTGSGTSPAAPTFAVSSTTTPQTIQPGGIATYSITATAQNGSFSAPVTLTASGFPVGATATFSPTSITPGSSSATSTLTIQTAKAVATLTPKDSPWPLAAPALALIGFFFLPGKRRRRWITLTILLLASLGTFSALTACGGGFGMSTATPATNYAVTITGTSGTVQQTTTVQLTVQ